MTVFLVLSPGFIHEIFSQLMETEPLGYDLLLIPRFILFVFPHRQPEAVKAG
jgi:hypothetical protein